MDIGCKPYKSDRRRTASPTRAFRRRGARVAPRMPVAPPRMLLPDRLLGWRCSSFLFAGGGQIFRGGHGGAGASTGVRIRSVRSDAAAMRARCAIVHTAHDDPLRFL